MRCVVSTQLKRFARIMIIMYDGDGDVSRSFDTETLNQFVGLCRST